jgi:hypothetical protein
MPIDRLYGMDLCDTCFLSKKLPNALGVTNQNVGVEKQSSALVYMKD